MFETEVQLYVIDIDMSLMEFSTITVGEGGGVKMFDDLKIFIAPLKYVEKFHGPPLEYKKTFRAPHHCAIVSIILSYIF